MDVLKAFLSFMGPPKMPDTSSKGNAKLLGHPEMDIRCADSLPDSYELLDNARTLGAAAVELPVVVATAAAAFTAPPAALLLLTPASPAIAFGSMHIGGAIGLEVGERIYKMQNGALAEKFAKASPVECAKFYAETKFGAKSHLFTDPVSQENMEALNLDRDWGAARAYQALHPETVREGNELLDYRSLILTGKNAVFTTAAEKDLSGTAFPKAASGEVKVSESAASAPAIKPAVKNQMALQ